MRLTLDTIEKAFITFFYLGFGFEWYFVSKECSDYVSDRIFLVMKGLTVISVWCHVSCMFFSPGYVTSESETKLQEVKSNERYCKFCKLVKPKSAHHCNTCRKCVLRMDHHCIWINNCVGKKNLKLFLQLLFYLLVTVSAGLALQSYCLFKSLGLPDSLFDFYEDITSKVLINEVFNITPKLLHFLESGSFTFIILNWVSFFILISASLFILTTLDDQYERLVNSTTLIDSMQRLPDQDKPPKRSFLKALREDVFKEPTPFYSIFLPI